MSDFLHHEVLRTVRLTNFTAILERKEWTRGSVYFLARGTPKATDPCRNVRKVAEEYRKFPGESFGRFFRYQRTQSRFPGTSASRSRGVGVRMWDFESLRRFSGKDFERKIKGFRGTRSDPGVLHSRSSRKFFKNNIILETPFWHFSPMHFFSRD